MSAGDQTFSSVELKTMQTNHRKEYTAGFFCKGSALILFIVSVCTKEFEQLKSSVVDGSVFLSIFQLKF